MSIKRKIVLALLFSILTTMFFTNTLYADNQPSIFIEFDKTKASVGETIKASVKINNIKDFGGYQVRLRYNPKVLQAVDADNGTPLENKTPPTKGDLLQNKDYSPMGLTTNIIEDGILDFGNLYMNMIDYKKSGKAETTGTLAVIGFKVLQDAATEVIFDDVNGNPGAINGVMLFDWTGAQLASGYSIVNAPKINASSKPIPLPSFTTRPTLKPSTAASPASSAAPETSASAVVSPDNTKADDNSAAKDETPAENKSTLIVVIIVLAAVVVIIPIIMVVLMKKRKK
ncbi:cohesin domain-containing protein [Pseudobacteroides cellulosolvens]|uniref:Cellulosome anchoring protein cohesin region n=1 Tax=Pseudobacteroides cellulosolvens ATCC 35603 = DSM 2933 TaxID=398512 RepID=A0A0L6JMM6_9FIRM|nr:cohesin domain-containing protein [Pseudobacteroides cellulosolvens]KNY27013.1 cellulosome anchoring protein cohesin region [Pseudobacteroides cellulosolvens ATCC 35603 = DSM 2933]